MTKKGGDFENKKVKNGVPGFFGLLSIFTRRVSGGYLKRRKNEKRKKSALLS